ncbi:MAG: YbfB/YjiJ family MFS transporter [Methylovirgula sp.]|jgi:MFS family permease
MSSALDRYKVLGAGIFSLILALGVARFSYTPLLPLMQKQAGLGVAEAGWLAAINYMGYLTGALVAALIGDLVLKDRLYRLGMVLAVLTTVMMGMTTNVVLWGVSRYLAGLSTAAGMLLGTGLILNWLIRHDHRSELGIHFSGIGFGIAGCAAAVALMNHLQLDWRTQWYVFAVIGAVLLWPALGWLPAPDRTTVTRGGAMMQDAPPSPAFLRIFMASYFCAGVGYVVSATFIVAIVDHLPGLSGQGTLVFLVLGLAAAPACIVWDLIARQIGELNALILAALLQIAGILLPVLGGLAAALCGAVLFGATFIGMVSLVLTMAGRYYPTRPAKMMGQMTLSYGIAQVIAPALTGSLAVRFGGYQPGLYLAAGFMAVGTILLILLRAMDARARVSVAPDLVA